MSIISNLKSSRFNWGTGIAITLILFAGLMSFMVYKAMQQDFDLVSETYYEDELVYQEVINQKTNALKLTGKPTLSINGKEIYLSLPQDLEGKTKRVETLMYHEQEADNDFTFTEESTTKNRFAIPFQKFDTGKWIAKVKVSCEGVNYFFEPEITL